MEKQQKKKPSSYLSKAKEELLNLIITDHAQDRQEARKITENLWNFMSKKLAQSYWNGVEAGASGRVQPKERKFNSKGDNINS
jgi:hypothetical protein